MEWEALSLFRIYKLFMYKKNVNLSYREWLGIKIFSYKNESDIFLRANIFSSTNEITFFVIELNFFLQYNKFKFNQPWKNLIQFLHTHTYKKIN